MRRFTLAAGALALALAGCSATQQTSFANMMTVACEKDGQYQPIALGVLQVAGAGIAPIGQAAALDAALVHPAVVAFCAQYAAKPVVVPVVPPALVVKDASGNVLLSSPAPVVLGAPVPVGPKP